MARRPQRKLTTVAINALQNRGYYGDGDGLYLRVAAGGAKMWAFRYTFAGCKRETGLGGFPLVSLRQARERARECHELLWRGEDPVEVRRRSALSAKGMITFREAAERYVAAHAAGWRNPKHRQQWSNTLVQYVYPVFGDVAVGQVDTDHVLQALKPIWLTKTETATRVRQRIEVVLDAAAAGGHRSGVNPARWRGHLDKLLARPSKVKTVVNHPALPYPELPAFMQLLRQRDGLGARALEFVILTAARTGEVIAMRWSEVDGEVWTVPASRMKAGREHRVPLSDAAVGLLAQLPRTSDFVFPGKPGCGLSNGALLAVLRRLGRGDVTPHGFRSCFRDWAAEQTNHPREACEAALAHVVKDKTEQAYRRGDLLEKRRALMSEWADYCHGTALAASA